MFLKINADAKGLQFTKGFETVGGVSSESGDGFYKDLIDAPFPAVSQHPLEVIPLFSGGAGNTLVGINLGQFPMIMGIDIVIIMILLCRKAVELAIGVRTDTAIGRNPQVKLPFRLRCGNVYALPFGWF